MKIEVYSPTIRRREMDAVLTAMVEDKIGPGEQARFLIQIAKERIRFDYCLALRSPAIALYMALKGLGLEPGRAVVISALSPLYYARVLEDLGLVPLYCDVQPGTAVISRESVEKVLASKPPEINPGCVILCNTLGFLGDGVSLAELGIPVIEDCSQSYGTVIGAETGAGSAELKPDGVEGAAAASRETSGSNTVSAGAAGVFAILGLEERDMLTSGGGALLFSINRRNAAVLRNLGNSKTLGDLPREYGLPDMNAALAVVQFREAAKNFQKRREIAGLYTQSALRTRHGRLVQQDIVDPGASGMVSSDGDSRAKQPVIYNNYAFPLILETGVKEVKAYARRKDIIVESAFDDTLIGSGVVSPEQCPEAYSLSLRTVLFPVYPRLSMADAGKVSRLILTLP